MKIESVKHFCMVLPQRSAMPIAMCASVGRLKGTVHLCCLQGTAAHTMETIISGWHTVEGQVLPEFGVLESRHSCSCHAFQEVFLIVSFVPLLPAADA